MQVRQLCLSRQLVPVSFFDDMRRPPAAAGADAVTMSAVSEDKKAELVNKLRQSISDEEDCSVSSRSNQANTRSASMPR